MNWEAPSFEWLLPGVDLSHMVERSNRGLPRHQPRGQIMAVVEGHKLLVAYRRPGARVRIPNPPMDLEETSEGVVIRGQMGPSPPLVLAARVAVGAAMVAGVVASLATVPLLVIVPLVAGYLADPFIPIRWRETPAHRRELDALRDAVVERFSPTGNSRADGPDDRS